MLSSRCPAIREERTSRSITTPMLQFLNTLTLLSILVVDSARRFDIVHLSFPGYHCSTENAIHMNLCS
jgi:hypothetical protein